MQETSLHLFDGFLQVVVTLRREPGGHRPGREVVPR
jgi:hypothetical protein